MEKNTFYLPGGVRVPIKETIEYAKNLAFLAALQTVGAALLDTPAANHWYWRALGVLVSAGTGLLNVLVSQYYRESWPGGETRSNVPFIAASIALIAVVGFVAKARIKEGW